MHLEDEKRASNFELVMKLQILLLVVEEDLASYADVVIAVVGALPIPLPVLLVALTIEKPT